MENRIREIDFIRALGALSVIAIHVSGAYIDSSRGAYFWNIGMRYAVPLFVIISGFVLFYVENLKKSFSCIAFWLKRFKKLLIPYVIWNLIYLLYSTRHDVEKVSSDVPAFLKELGHNILTGVGTYHLYFVLIMLQLYLLYPIIRPFVKKYMNISLAVSLAITAYSQAIIYLGVQNKAEVPQTYIPFFILFPVWIFFFVFGMYVAKNLEALKEKVFNKSIILGFVWLLSYVLLIFDTKFTKTLDLSVKPSVLLYSVLSFLFFYSIALKKVNIQNRFGTLLDFLSEQSFLIYLSHVLFLKLIDSYSYIAGFGEFWENSRHQILLYIATIIVSSGFAYIMSFSSITVFIGGVHKRYLPDYYQKKEKPGMGI